MATIALLDVNVWIGLAFQNRAEHPRSLTWFNSMPNRKCVFCRTTQTGFLRVSTNPNAVGTDVRTMAEAWKLYDQFYLDQRIGFAIEPATLELEFRSLTQRNTHSPNLWSDALLAAFAIRAGFELVTFDTGFRQFSGLNCTIL